MTHSPQSTPFGPPLAPTTWLRRATFLLLAVGTISLSACKDDDDDPSTPTTPTPAPTTVFYVGSNKSGANMNSVLAYRLKADGNIELLAGSPFMTGGAGFANPTQALGPDDTDECLALSPDKKRLFAVNQGSNTIAVFNIGTDGKLTAVAGSPFNSGGNNPCSIGVVGNRIVVVNKSDDGDSTTMEPAPTYNVFDVAAATGALSATPGGMFATKPGASPAHAYISPNQKLLFVDDFLAFMPPNPMGTLRALAIGTNGSLTPAPNTPMALPLLPPAMMAGGALGLWSHPTQNVLYVGMPMQDQIGVYTYDANSGALTFVRGVASGIPGAPATAVCWMRVNKAGTRMYSLNSGEGTVSVFNTADAQNPVMMQTLTLKSLGPLYDTMSPAGMLVSSEPFHLTMSPDEKTMLIVSQHTNPDFSANYNYVHTLTVAADGMLAEPTNPMQPPVDARTRPQGVVSVTF